MPFLHQTLQVLLLVHVMGEEDKCLLSQECEDSFCGIEFLGMEYFLGKGSVKSFTLSKWRNNQAYL